jgi:hypothetical protein
LLINKNKLKTSKSTGSLCFKGYQMNSESLFEAIEAEDYNQVIECLKQGGDPNGLCKDGYYTPFRSVSGSRKIQNSIEENRKIAETLIELIRYGAKVTSRDFCDTFFLGNYPIDAIEEAFKVSKKQVIKKFNLSRILHISSNAMAHESDYVIALFELYERLTSPLDSNALGLALADSFWDTQSGHGSSEYGCLYRESFTPVVEYLIGRGANLNVKSRYKEHTSLMRAAMNEYPEVCELLLKHGAGVNEVNEKGFTALMFVSGKIYSTHMWEPNQEQFEIAKMLLKNNADISLKANNKRTALSYAKSSNNLKVLEIIELAKVAIKT